MKSTIKQNGAGKLGLWGGLECTVNRVGERYFNQVERNGHERRLADVERFAALGIEAIRYPVLWERVAPEGVDQADWAWTDRQLPALRCWPARAPGVTPGSSTTPRSTSR
jgi:dTDP-4-dehydrorhamnose reductase